MKIRTIVDLSELVDRDYTWRVREIANIKQLLSSSNESRQPLIMRAAIALSYAHWEGFIKRSTQWYLVYINSQRHSYIELKTQFAVFGLKGEINKLANSRKHKFSTEILEAIFNMPSSRVYMALSDAVDTQSNLNSEVFENIAYSVAIDSEKYKTKYNFIDEGLLGRRNKVAHGEEIGVSRDIVDEALNLVLLLLKDYKDDLMNAASQADYLK